MTTKQKLLEFIPWWLYMIGIPTIIGAAVLLILSFQLQGANPHKQQPPPPTTGPITISLAASNWQEIAHPANSVPLTNCCNGALTFNFPIEDGFHPSMNYLTTALGSSHGKKHQSEMDLSGYHYIGMRIQVQVTGTPTFNWILFDPGNTCNAPAKLHPFFEQANNNGGATYRWWGNPTEFVLPPYSAAVDIAVPLTPGQWSDVNGEIGTSVPAGFAAALKNVANVGMTFGGGCFAGHGLNINPGATYQVLVLNYSIQ